MDFTPYPKMPRLSRKMIITEKIDGTNAQVFISDDCKTMLVGSRRRWITPSDDNMGFARWCEENRDELMKLGPGRHFGEWWGQKIQRNYGLKERRFSLFNTSRWTDDACPACCHVVPVLYTGAFDTTVVDHVLSELETNGSYAAPGFANPEGVVVFHTAGNFCMKKTIEKDGARKSVPGL